MIKGFVSWFMGTKIIIIHSFSQVIQCFNAIRSDAESYDDDIKLYNIIFMSSNYVIIAAPFNRLPV